MNGGNKTNFDHNKYYSFKLNRYTNIKDNDINLPPMEKSIDDIIPMVPCKYKMEFDGGWSQDATKFCP